MTDANNQLFVPPESSFRDSYTNLILAIWQNPDLENQIMANPTLITQFGFTVVPQSIRFEPPGATVTPEEYEAYQAEFTADQAVTLHIPPQPIIQPGSPGDFTTQNTGTIACCCTPCCCCGGGRPGGRPPQDPS
jgi:hypothetical protein